MTSIMLPKNDLAHNTYLIQISVIRKTKLFQPVYKPDHCHIF